MRPLAALALLVVACSPSGDAAGPTGGALSGDFAGADLAVGVPDDAALVLVTSDWSDVADRARNNAWVRLFSGGTGSDLVRFLRAWTRADEPDGLDLLAALEAVDGLAAGMSFLEPELEPGLTLLVRTRGETAALEALERRLLREATGDEAPDKRRHEGAELLVHHGRSDVEVLFKEGDLHGLTAGSTEEEALTLAKGALDRLHGRGGGRGITGAPILTEAFAGGSRDAILHLAADVPRWLRMIDRDSSAEERARREAFGLTQVPWASLEVSLGEGQAVGVRLATRVPSSTELGAMLDTLRPAPLERFDAIPDCALGAVVGRLDPAVFFERFERVLAARDPHGLEDLETGLRKIRDELGLDLRRDVLAGWDGAFALFGSPPSPATLMEAGRRGLGPSSFVELGALVELADPAPLARALRMIAPGGPTSWSVAGLQIEALGPAWPMRPQWAVHERQLLFALADAPMRSLAERCAGVDSASVLSRPGLRGELGPYADAALVTVVPARYLAQTLCNLLRTAGFSGHDSGTEPMRFLADLRLPTMERIEGLLHGHAVQALRRSGDRLELALTIR